MKDANKAEQKGKTGRKHKLIVRNLAIRKVKLQGKKGQRGDYDQAVVCSPSVVHCIMISSNYGNSSQESSRRQVLVMVAH